MNQKEKFKNEFGIHFKNSPDELKFALTFLEETQQQTAKEIIEMGEENFKRMLELYNGKMPFVTFEGKATEGEKVAIYRCALKDLLQAIKNKYDLK